MLKYFRKYSRGSFNNRGSVFPALTEKVMKKKFVLPVILLIAICLFAGCAHVSNYASSERLSVLSEKYDELKNVSNEVSESLTSSQNSDATLYDEFNALAVSANTLATEINSYIDKQIEKNVCESLISRCEELIGKYKDLGKKIEAAASTTVPESSSK